MLTGLSGDFFHSARTPSLPTSSLAIEHGQYFPGHSCSFARYLSLSYKDPELRINFTLPTPSFSQPRHRLTHPPLGTAMYREQWKWLTATLNPGKASLIRHQRQNQRHRQCCNSRVNSPPCARNTEAAKTFPLITGVSQKRLTSFHKPLPPFERWKFLYINRFMYKPKKKIFFINICHSVSWW